MTGIEYSARIEQRTLKISLAGVAAVATASLAWGLAIESDVVILNGVFSLVSLVGSVLYLVAAKLVVRPADRRFQYGYAHVEPLVNGVNGLLVLVICVYAFVNGLEGLRAGGDAVDAASVIWFGAVTRWCRWPLAAMSCASRASPVPSWCATTAGNGCWTRPSAS